MGASAAGAAVSVVGSGSNLLIADDGVAGLVLKLDRELAQIERDGARIRLRRRRAAAGGRGAGRARGALGDRVRREHPGHGRRRGADERERLRRRAGAGAGVGRVVTAGGVRSAARPEQLGFAYRRSNIAPGEIVARARFCAPATRDRGIVTATLAEMRARRHEAQPQGIKTFGSTFKNPTIRARRGAARGCCSQRRAATA